ncbi:non-ribosomal peptide synthetase [Paenibacillus sp. UMB4589-SE434]|uniref:non-ribosomal peptide synthetase n=1 Tax=Paenibacillus sp. UMB4589-SE434 TaxID=3046314 RepID=UPI00254D6003|nr:non-ribosomal peptide synthetase [Paenibacillus sp. UMB4589-SE434]MDK8179804.1 amino acid adenylation domain-containing protein [Paenibacillus sp. UMB4589-SE434]
MEPIRHLAELLLKCDTNSAGITFLQSGQDQSYTYSELHNRAAAVLVMLQERGIPVACPVIIQTEDNEAFIILFWACVLGGYVPVPVTAAHNDEQRNKLLQIYKELGVAYVIAASEAISSLGTYSSRIGAEELYRCLVTRTVLLEEVLSADLTLAACAKLHTPRSEDTAFIQFSSGSTGNPKGVVLTHDNLLANMSAILAGSRTTESDSSLSWLPLTHDMGLIGFHLTPILGRIHQYQMTTSAFVLHPMNWLRTASERRISCLASPNFGYSHFLQHFKPEQAVGEQWDLSCIRLIFNGAEPISEAICRQFLVSLKPYGLPSNSLFPVYGLAEASLAVTFPDPEEELRVSYLDREQLGLGSPVCLVEAESKQAVPILDLGYPVKDCAVSIRDEDQIQMDEGRIGLIYIQGRNVTAGYYNLPDANKQLITPDGWLNTGDLGYVVGGRLFVTGRMKDILFVNGQNLYPHDLEQIASEAQSLSLGKIAVCGVQDPVSKQDEIVVFVQHRGKLESFTGIRADVKSLLNRATGLDVTTVLPIRQIPKTTSGKIQRYLLAERFASGEFTEAATKLTIWEIETLLPAAGDNSSLQGQDIAMTDTEIRIADFWSEVLGISQPSMNAHFLELGGNSLKAGMIASRLQDTWAIEASLGEVLQHETIRSLAAWVDSCSGNKQAEQAIPIIPVGARAYYPLTSAQNRLYVLQQINPSLTHYNLPYEISLTGACDQTKLAAAWQDLTRRHVMLRTSISMLDGTAVQYVAEEVELPLLWVDGTDWTEEQIRHYSISFVRPFKMEQAPLFRVEIVKLAHDRHLMLLDMHHIITDGSSMGIWIREFAALYDGVELPAQPLQYTDIALWLDMQRNTSEWERSRQYWQTTFTDGCPRLTLPLDQTRPLTPSYSGRVESVRVDAALVNKLNKLAHTSGCTLYTVLVSLYYVLLSRYSGQQDIVIGTAAAGRTRTEMEQVAGLFVNMIPLRLRRTDVSPKIQETNTSPLAVIEQNADQTHIHESSSTVVDITLNAWFRAVQEQLSEALRHQTLPFEEMMEAAGHISEMGRHPLFDTAFTLQNMDLPELRTKQFTCEIAPLHTSTSKFDMSWEGYVTAQGLDLHVEFSLELFRSDSIRQMLRCYTYLLEQAVDNSVQTLNKLELMSEPEQAQLIMECSEMTDSRHRDMALHEWFEWQVDEQPEAIALEMGEHKWHYAKLNSEANRLARWLMDKSTVSQAAANARREGARPCVALIMDRSMEMIAAMLAVLKAGMAYVPIDPSFPTERIRYMFEDAQISAALVNGDRLQLRRELEESGALPSVWFHVTEQQMEYINYDESNLAVATNVDDVAYMMYTSGTTGRPKGIYTTHANVTRVVRHTNYLELTAHDTLLQLSNYAFDGSTFDIYGALLNGSRLIMLQMDEIADPFRIMEQIVNKGVTVFFATTALFNMLVDHDLAGLMQVRHVLFGGERASMSHVRRAYDAMGPGKLLHVYGPTETTVFASCYPILSWNSEQVTIPIGQPITRTELYVLDAEGRMAAKGAAGELYIGGDGLALGYANLPAMTAERFVKHCTDSTRRMYRTSDLVRWNADGQLEYLDRLDKQVKLRGYRIELGEIESAWLRLPDVREAYITTRELGGDLALCAYIVADKPIVVAEYVQELRRVLPYYMVPAAVIQLDKLPLTSNGKVDMRALPAPEAAFMVLQPETETERDLQLLWQEALNVDEIGVTDHFFERGGHSLKASKLASLIYKHFHLQMPIQQIFSLPTIREQAAWIDGHDKVDRSGYRSIPAAVRMPAYPTSPAQQRMYLLDQFEGVGTTYHMPILFEVEGELTLDLAEAAWQKMITTHEPFRTSFRMYEGHIQQLIHESAAFQMNQIVLPDKVEGWDKKELTTYCLRYLRPFCLSEAPLLHGYWIIAQSKRYMLIDIHHIVADGISLQTLISDWARCVAGYVSQPPEVQYKDYAVWLNGEQAVTDLKRSEAYWQQQLPQELPVLELPTDFSRGDQRSFRGGLVPFELSSQTGKRMAEHCERRGLTMNSFLFSLYSLLLHQFTGQDECIIGSLASGRTHPDTEQMIGMFNAFLPIFIGINSGRTVDEHTKYVQDQLSGAYSHQEFSVESLINLDQRPVPYDRSRNPLFDTMLIVHNQMDAEEQVCGHGFKLKPLPLHTATAKLDVKLDIFLYGDGRISGAMEYNTDLFKEETISRLVAQWLHLMEQALQQPEQGCCELLRASEADTVLLSGFNETSAPFPSHMLLHQWLEEQARAHPDRTAVRCAEQELTYRQLNERANQFARVLRGYGVKADTVVPVVAERSLELFVGIFAILKAGGAYLPISPEYPEERIRYFLEDSQSKLVCTQHKWRKSLPFYGTVIELDDETCGRSKDRHDLVPVSTPQHLAYVIYTSGSTGMPKGVMVEHCAIVNRIHWMQQAYPLTEADIILHKTPITFDVSVWELFWWSAAGATVYVLEPGGEKDPVSLIETIDLQRITIMHFVPSMLGLFLRSADQRCGDDEYGMLSSLRFVFTSGEALMPQHVETFRKIFKDKRTAALVNLYGPTEAAVDVTAYACDAYCKGSVPIGSPISNIQLYIVNEELEQQPIGVPGQLCIAGTGLARGYWNKPALTAERFVEHPHQPATRMYLTGDRARWLPDGNIEYQGRMDQQVKIRGIRIECGEIEHVLLRHSGIAEAVVTAVEDKLLEQVLCAYIVPQAAGKVSQQGDHQLEQLVTDPDTVFSSQADMFDDEELMTWMQRLLPEYMIPVYIIRLDQLPLTPSGKLDRRNLPLPSWKTGGSGEAPQTSTEQQLAAIWQQVLAVTAPARDDHFFMLGGHSLRAAQLAGLVEQQFQVQFTLQHVFQAPVLRHMATVIETAGCMTSMPLEPVEKRPNYPLSLAQNRLFILQEMDQEQTAYNLPFAVHIKGALDTETLERALIRLVEEHEPLRTSFKWYEGAPVQCIVESEHVEMRLEHYNQSKRHQSLDEAMLEAAKTFIRPFDLSKAPLMRACLMERGSDEFTLMMDMHHIVSDGISMNIMADQLVREYEYLHGMNNGTSKANDDRHSLTAAKPLRIQYKDYAVWQQQWMSSEARTKEETYWREALEGSLPLLHLPLDYTRPALQSFKGECVYAELTQSQLELVKAAASKLDMTLFMYVLTAFHALLFKVSGQEDIIVGTPIGGRLHTDTEPLIGMFVNTLPIRTRPTASITFSAFAHQVKHQTVQAFAHQTLPFEQIVTALQVPRDLSRNPIFDVLFVMQNMGLPSTEVEGLQFDSQLLNAGVSKLDLTVEVTEIEGGLHIRAEYATALFERTSVLRLLDYYMHVLTSAAAQPDAALGELRLMTHAEECSMYGLFNCTRHLFPVDMTLGEAVEQYAKDEPARTALLVGDREVTYGELQHQAEHLAHLLRSKGVKTDSLVAICMERSLAMIVAILGIWKAGGAYVPISPSQPLDRMRFVLEDSNTSLVLVETGSEMLQADLGDVVLVPVSACMFASDRLDDMVAMSMGETQCSEQTIHSDNRQAITDNATSNDAAYVIYTSGSTGQPKGVLVEHQAAVNRIHWMQEMYPLHAEDVILQKTPYTFDVSVWELIWWAFGGAKVALLEPGEEKDPSAIVAAIARYRVTTIHFVPSMLELFLAHLEHNPHARHGLSSLRYVFTSGEALKAEHVERFKQLMTDYSNAALINLYGPTEAAIDVTYYDCSEWQGTLVPIGKPIYNTELYVVNDQFQRQPIGIPGELCIAGTCLARGYVNREELTAERFIVNPYVPGSKMYRTGDMARWLPDGNIEYLGRLDNQVKVRGFRIECGEIEHALLKEPFVRDAIVVKLEDSTRADYLCAYLVTTATVTAAQLRASLQLRLPEYMIPAVYVELESMPLTSNGKVDRRRLPRPEHRVDSGQEFVEAKDGTEEVVASVWRELLGRERIGSRDNFFDCGGDSLLIIRMHHMLDRRYPGLLKVTDLFNYPTVSGLAAYIDVMQTGHLSADWSGLQVPEQLLNRTSSTEWNGLYRFEVDKMLLDGLRKVSHAEGIRVNELMLAVLAWYFKQATGSQNVQMLHMNDEREARLIKIDFTQTQDFHELVSVVTEGDQVLKRLEQWRKLPTGEGSKNQSIAPLFYEGAPHKLAVNYELLQAYELIVSLPVVTVEHAVLKGEWAFNGQRMDKERMRHWLQGYVKLLRLVVQQFEHTVHSIGAETAASTDKG